MNIKKDSAFFSLYNIGTYYIDKSAMSLSTILYIFSIIGVLDTLYLISVKLRGGEVACFFFPKEWCHKVQHSTYSSTFGVSNSYLGFIMYVAILVLTWLFVAGTIPFWPITLVVTVGFLFSLYFLYIQAFVLHAFCIWCIVSLINFTVMTWAVYFF